MTIARAVRRGKFDLTAQLRDERCLSPDARRRDWLCSRALEETADDLEHLDRLSRDFVASGERPEIEGDWATSPARCDETELVISGQQVMQAWQRPYMDALAALVSGGHGDVLEIGFGMGLAASRIQAAGVRSHTLVEANLDVVAQAERWKRQLPSGTDVRIVAGRWQDVVDDLGAYDGVLFDAYPASEEEFHEFAVEDITFAHQFFETASRHLRPGGVFTYFSNEVDSISRRHQRALLEYFKTVTVSVCDGLTPPDGCHVWWAHSILVVAATK
jgi:guanidinoacetate N-methyltransferase